MLILAKDPGVGVLVEKIFFKVCFRRVALKRGGKTATSPLLFSVDWL